MSTAILKGGCRAGRLRSGSVPTATPRTRRTARASTTTERLLDPGKLGGHFDRLFRAAWAMCGSRELAEDLVQETYVSVLSRPRLLRRDDDLGYLLKALRNTWYSHLRRERLRRESTSAFPERPEEVAATSSRDDPQASVEAAEVIETIATLPAEFREALVAIDIAGLSYAEAAKALRVRKATITSRLFRARNRVAESLSQP
jgi:RNA polymerase sigma-70 factor, ECF subfamily